LQLQLNASKTESLWCAATARWRHQFSRCASRIKTDALTKSTEVRDLRMRLSRTSLCGFVCDEVLLAVCRFASIARYTTISSIVSFAVSGRCSCVDEAGLRHYSNLAGLYRPDYSIASSLCWTADCWSWSLTIRTLLPASTGFELHERVLHVHCSANCVVLLTCRPEVVSSRRPAVKCSTIPPRSIIVARQHKSHFETRYSIQYGAVHLGNL